MIYIEIFKFIKKNWVSILLSLGLLGMVIYHFFWTYNPPVIKPVIVSPITKVIGLNNGDIAYAKTHTPGTESPQDAGFSEEFVKDTIQGILQIKAKEILTINKLAGSYKDSLELVKEELDAEKRIVKIYQSKDSKGKPSGTAVVTEGKGLVYTGNVNLISVVKKGETKRGKTITPDQIVFYDPEQRLTINESKEYTYTLPVSGSSRKGRLRISPQIGIGVVAPIEVENNKPKLKDLGFGVYGGVGISYTF